MKKIVPFKRNLTFKTNLAEITSISLEHTLHLTDKNLVTGNFIITGDYKIADSSTSTESFKFELPFDINIDDKYITDNIALDIDDFYYEIVDSKVLAVSISVLLDKLEEKPLIKEIIEQKEMSLDSLFNDVDEKDIIETKDIVNENRDTIKETKDAVRENKESIIDEPKERCIEDEEVKDETSIINTSIFDNFSDTKENYSTYKVYIVRENDTIEAITQKYSLTKEDIEMYNDISDIKIGDKLILPSINAKI